MTVCIDCQTQFEITDRDRQFYASIGVPEPLRCPLCRRQRLLCWRNQRTLYRRKCHAPGHSEDIISIFAPDAPYTIYDRDFWWSDAWDPKESGAEVDFFRPFSDQFNDLLHRVPLVGIFNGRSVNSQYCNHLGEAKDCYLTFASWKVEKVHYGDLMIDDRDSVDCLETKESEQCYECVGCIKSYNFRYGISSVGCRDSWFLFDCRNCSDCVGCTNLRNKQYHIFNEPMTKEAYFTKLKVMRLDTAAGISAAREKFLDLKRRSLHRFATLTNCEDATGDQLIDVKRSQMCFSIDHTQDSAFCINGGLGMKEVWDGYGIGAVLERGYQIFDTGAQGADNLFGGVIWGCQAAYYSYNCHNCTEIFGCYGLRGQKYCILNKQYSKEDYEKLKVRLIDHMKTTGEWGEFFPPSVSPFGLNETLAHEYTPLTKEAALTAGFKWQDRVPGVWGKETIGWDKIGETIKDVPATITKELMACQDCKRNYGIVAQELSFYQKMDLPIPRQCPECRYQSRLKTRNPHWLWRRSCMCEIGLHAQHLDDKPARPDDPGRSGGCRNEFETPYAPDCPERIFCEPCYQAEVV